MKPTPEQQIAIETQDRSLVVSAGAGTGKTWVLVQRFMHLLDTHLEWPLDSILAITFTEKAAREMRTRLRQAIEARATQRPHDPHWRDHRLNLDRLQVITIHSLCARILRENALSAGIDPRFQVLDEQESDLLKEQAIRDTLRALDEQDHPALELLASLRLYDLRNEMESMLAKRGTLHQLFDHLEEPEALLARWRAGLSELRTALWEAQLRGNPDLAEVLRSLPEVPIADPDDHLARSVVLAQDGCREYARGELVTAVTRWLGIDLRGGRKDSWGGKEALSELKDELRLLREAARALEKDGALLEIGPADEQAAEHLQLWRSLWATLDGIYTRIKESRQALDFDDLELLTYRLLTQAPRAGRLGGFLAYINHLMVDEFQDTNIIQQRIVYALASPDQPGKLFVVGDAKQSIYRFRQAQVSIFNQTADQVEIITGFPPAPLSTSFRTHHRLIGATNVLFDTLLAPFGIEHAPYEAVPGPLTASRPTHPAHSAPVEMLLLPSKDADGATVNAEDGRIWEAGWIAQRLLALEVDQYPVWDKELEAYHPFEFKDAAVLFRATTQLPLYEAEFKKFGLPYLTVSGRGYFDRREVQDLVALLSALANPADDLNLAAALRSPLFSLSDETLYRLRWHTPDGGHSPGPIPYVVALSQPPSTAQPDLVDRARSILLELWESTDRVDVWDLLRSALDLTAYEVTLSRSDGGTGRQYANVRKFLVLARDGKEVNLSAFLNHLRDLKAREAREGEALGREPESGAVQLMSIHAAKGLEFPVVVLADLGREKGGGSRSPYLRHDPAFGLVCKVRDELGDWVEPAGYAWGRWLDKRMEEAESARLLYVACTRAADLLILSGKTGRRNTWLADILAAWEVPESGPAEDIIPFGEFAVRLFRPENPPEPPLPEPGPVVESPPVITQIPHLARPLPEVVTFPPTAVTRLGALLGVKDIHQQGIHPAIYAVERPTRGKRAPRRLVGLIVHQALARWSPLRYPDGELLRFLGDHAQRQGVFPVALPDAVHRSRRILTRFRYHDLYARIDRAPRRYHEVPFTLDTSRGIVHGVIDLLYQDQSGTWHLLDWKTEFAPNGAIDEIAGQHLTQMAAYADAIRGLLDIRPQVGLCFMVPEIVYHPFSNEALENAWSQLAK